MDPIINNILPAYLGNHGLSYAGNDNIPNPWTMIFNPYYHETLHLFYPTHLNLWHTHSQTWLSCIYIVYVCAFLSG
jgi:hypothetical protein